MKGEKRTGAPDAAMASPFRIRLGSVRGAIAVVLTTLALGLGLGAAASVTLGLFTDTAQIQNSVLDSDTLNAASGLSATGGATVSLNWTATADTYADGHRVLRGTATGGPYSQIAEVTPRTTTTYNDDPGAGTYYYVVRAFYQNWESVNSNEASATDTSGTANTGFVNCTANAAVTTSAGDNNGFQTNPGNACANDGAFAEDTNSGSNTNTTCADTGKDRHQYYNYGHALPAGSTVSGIEVRLDAWADATTGSPFMCVELSWNNGTSWTAAKNTSTLTASEATYTLGSSSDTWGHAWTLTELTDGNLRIRITNVASNSSRDFRLDWVAVQVTYNTPANLTDSTFRSCAANAAVTSSAGDNNGFQLNPGNACADDGAFAEDTDSGTNTTTTCSDAGKDRHLFYNYGFSVPAGATIHGIEVRLDTWADLTTGSPFMCVELSWDGGTSWTAAKSTGPLGTADAAHMRGAAGDTWGRTWASTDFSDANFRVRITNVASDNARDFRLDWIRVNVTYTP
jgi:hypothetical protein